MKGRKKVPSGLNDLRGNPGKRGKNAGEPNAPGVKTLRVPRGRLGKHGGRLWRDLAPVLDRIGVLKDTDLAALELLCDHYGFAVAAGEALREQGLVIYDDKGQMKKSPYVQIFRENAVAFRLMAGEFGLTPSSRARLDVGVEEEQSLAEVLFDLVGSGES